MFHIRNKKKYLIVILFFSFSGEDCNLINSTGPPVPTYIHIDSFAFNPAYGFAVTTHQITTVWAYYNNNPIGSFDLPCTIPVIATGTGNLELSPGITIDGLSDLTGVYPFYTIDTSSFTAQPGKIINYTPQTQYYSDVAVTGISYFNGRTNFAVWEGIGTPMTLNYDSLPPTGSRPGVGVITLGPSVDSCVDSSVSAFVIPSGDAFIELDYKCNVPFALGLQANIPGVGSSTPYYFAGIYPSSTWQKFYLSVADFAAQYKATNYNFYIKAVLPPGQSGGTVFLDNIQLVSF